MALVELGNRFIVGEKVRFLAPYGETLYPKRWEKEPYRVIGIIVDFYANALSKHRIRYRVQPWANAQSCVAFSWEHQLEPWIEGEQTNDGVSNSHD